MKAKKLYKGKMQKDMKIRLQDAYNLSIGNHDDFELIAHDGRAVTHRVIVKRKSNGLLYEFLFIFLPEHSKFHGDKEGYVFYDLNLYAVKPVEKIIIEYERIL